MSVKWYSTAMAVTWRTLEASGEFAEIFPEGNRIKVASASQTHPEKPSLTTIDYPQCTVFPTGATHNTRASFSQRSRDLTLVAEIVTGEDRIDTALKAAEIIEGAIEIVRGKVKDETIITAIMLLDATAFRRSLGGDDVRAGWVAEVPIRCIMHSAPVGG